MPRQALATWTRPSSTSDRTYTVTAWDDGTDSCNCPGWTRRVGKDGRRTCKHLRELAAVIPAAVVLARTRPDRLPVREYQGGAQAPSPGRAPVQDWRVPATDRRTIYQVTRWSDGSMSCTCPDWLYRRQAAGEDCKHIRGLRPAMADPRRVEPEAPSAEPRALASTATPAQIERITRLMSRGEGPPAPDPPPKTSARKPFSTARPKRAIRFDDA